MIKVSPTSCRILNVIAHVMTSSHCYYLCTLSSVPFEILALMVRFQVAGRFSKVTEGRQQYRYV